MAVSSRGRNVQLTRLTATCPTKRMVRSRVSRVKVMSHSRGCKCPASSRASRGSTYCSLSLIADRNVHFLNLDLADRFVHRPRQVRIDLDLEVIHALQCLMVLFPEDHLALRRIELHAFHRGDQLLAVGGFRLGDGGYRGHRRRKPPPAEEIR